MPTAEAGLFDRSMSVTRTCDMYMHMYMHMYMLHVDMLLSHVQSPNLVSLLSLARAYRTSRYNAPPCTSLWSEIAAAVRARPVVVPLLPNSFLLVQ